MKPFSAVLLFALCTIPLAVMGSKAPKASGFYRVERLEGDHWNLIDPKGKPFYSMGVGVVKPRDHARKEGAPHYNTLPKYNDDLDAWAVAATKRLQRYGFNSLGAWSDEPLYGKGLAFTHMLALSGYHHDRLVDVWTKEFQSKIEKAAAEGTKPWKNSRDLIGYYMDNELPWYGDTGWPGPQNTPLLDKYMALQAGSPGKKAAVKVLKEHFKGDLKALAGYSGVKAGSWEKLESKVVERGSAPFPEKARTAMMALVAEKYFSVCEAAVRKADPNHLLLGVRFAGSAPDVVVRACGRHNDIVSFNLYSKSGHFNQKLFDRVYLLAGRKPMMLTEFSYRAMENRSGNKNTKGADVTVQTQADRAAKLHEFIRQGLELPYLVGYHWFNYFDQSPEGRSFDGEDSNYGIVDIHDREYEQLRDAFIKLNAVAPALHARASHPVPEKIEPVKEITVREISAMTGDLAASKAFTNLSDAGLLRVWNEASAGGHAVPYKKGVAFSYKTGDSWGVGLGVGAAGKNSDGSADRLGYRAVVVTARFPKGHRFEMFLNESGIAGPDQGVYKSVGGADGEGYESRVFTGTGEAKAYRINLEELKLRTAWGNQQGNRVVDIQAIESLDLHLNGGQGEGKAWVQSIEFVR